MYMYCIAQSHSLKPGITYTVYHTTLLGSLMLENVRQYTLAIRQAIRNYKKKIINGTDCNWGMWLAVDFDWTHSGRISDS